MSERPNARPAPWVLAAIALALFLVWSNSFVAMGYLLGGERAEQQLDWFELTVARFTTAGAVSGLYCLLARFRESVEIVRRYPGRLILSGLLVVPVYSFALFYGQEHGVSPPIASLTTALTPMFVLGLSAIFLRERLTTRRVLGLVVACVGMVLIASARGEIDPAYPWLIALIAIAPLSWSVYSVISKPLTTQVSPLLWSYLALAIGGLSVAPGLVHTWPRWSALDLGGWFALLYLAVPCAVVGNAAWTWLLQYLSAGTVGFTVFLNPPLTALSKAVLAALFPAVFVFSITGQEWLGAGVVLLGMAFALWPRR